MGKRLSVLLLASMLLSLLVPAAQAAGAAGGIDVYFYEEAAGAYGALTQTDLVTLTLDGAPLAPDGVPALVQYLGSDGRTLVPVRLIAEKLGAAVTWVPDTRQVLILESGRNIVLTLGSSTALVNGQTVELPGGVPAGVVKWDGLESTMVPLRFVSEQLGATVDWDNDSFTAILTSPGASVTPEPSPGPSPTPTPLPTPALPPVPSGDDRGYITGVSSDSDTQTVLIETDHVPEYRVLDLGDRVAVDVLGAVLHSGEAGMVTIPVDNDMITAVRYYQHEDDLGYGYPHTVRVVLDLKSGITYSKNLKVEAGSSGVRVTAFLTDGDREDTDFTPSAPIDPSKSTIVLDAGHGGARSGAVYPDASGTDVLEKDLALSMTLKLRDRLVAAGYNVVLTRESESAHLTASGLVLNGSRTKVLMARHDLYRVWAWTGGHADGDGDLLSVALREAREETGVSRIRPITGRIDSLEILPVWGHRKRGRYVSAHLHLNVSYLLEADETDPLTPRPGENSAVGWLPVDGLPGLTNEWQMDDVYRKLLQRAGAAV